VPKILTTECAYVAYIIMYAASPPLQMRYAQRAAPAGSGDGTSDAHDDTDTADRSGETVSAYIVYWILFSS
jgi:hypothetical protein